MAYFYLPPSWQFLMSVFFLGGLTVDCDTDISNAILSFFHWYLIPDALLLSLLWAVKVEHCVLFLNIYSVGDYGIDI